MIADDDLEQTLLTISAAFEAVEARWALAAPCELDVWRGPRHQ
jgi:hypothetical protein